MAMTITTTIRNMKSDYSSPEDWESDGGFARDYDKLVEAEAAGELVTIVSEATDGYFDVKFADGHTIEALSWWHLAGFHIDGRINFNSLLS